ncbi:MAG: zinc ribbon domain-containing protein [Thermoprotei archaeon]
MPFIENIERVSDALVWTDHLPLGYKYSLGPMGEKFSKALLEGKLVAAYCAHCQRAFIPPTTYCTKCFRSVSDVKEIDYSTGKVYSYTQKSGKTIAAITFENVEGRLIHLLNTPSPEIGLSVVPAFKPKPQRDGSIADIMYFEPKH